MRKMFSKNQIKELSVQAVNSGIESGDIKVVLNTSQTINFTLESEENTIPLESKIEFFEKYNIFKVIFRDAGDNYWFIGLCFKNNNIIYGIGYNDLSSNIVSLHIFNRDNNGSIESYESNGDSVSFPANNYSLIITAII